MVLNIPPYTLPPSRARRQPFKRPWNIDKDCVLCLMPEINTKWIDHSSYGNDGTIIDATLVHNGRYGQAIDFNGTSSLVNCGTDTSLNITAALTLTTWVKWGVLPSAGPSWQVPITKGAIKKGYGIVAGAAHDKISFTTRDGGGDYRAWSNSPLITDVWYHICGVFDGTNIKLYINAQYQTQVLAGIGDSATVPLRFGLDNWGNRFQGRVDETRIYKKALTPEEILALYEQGRPGGD